MLYPLGKLLADRELPITINATKKVSDALNLMIANDFSQLPVVDAAGALVGIISEKTIAKTYYFQRAAVSLLDLTVDHCKARAVTMSPEDDLFDALDRLRETACIVIVKDKKPFRILTDYDSTHFFRDTAEGLILIEDIEVTLRQYINAIYRDEPALDTALINVFGADKADPAKSRRDYERISLGDHIRLITHEKNWPEFNGVFEPQRMFEELMDQVRRIRNQLAHFRDRLDPVQRQALLQARLWLDSRPKLNQVSGEKQQTVHVTSSDIPTSAVSDKYASLEQFLQRHGDEGPVIRVSFDDIEAVLGEALPSSATTHRSWWNNDPSNHLQARAWLEAGWLVDDVDLAARVVLFRLSNAALYPLFFTDVVERFKKERPGVTRATAVRTDNWWSFSAGRSGFNFGWVLPREPVLRVELYIDLGDQAINKTAFDMIHQQKDAIEQEIGEPLKWERLDERRASRISISRPTQLVASPEQLEQSKAWAVTLMLKFLDAFQPRIRELKL
jgi:CBS domain-containing protein